MSAEQSPRDAATVINRLIGEVARGERTFEEVAAAAASAANQAVNAVRRAAMVGSVTTADCTVDGHDLEQVRVGAEIVQVICGRCPPTFVPPQLPQVASSDVRVDVYSTGGRHSLRLTHVPTGLVAESGSEPSQLQNRERAMRILRARLLVAQLEREATP